MPLTWTQDRAAAPSTSAAPSGRISASPTQTRSINHRRGLPQSTSTSSNLSAISIGARSTSGSQYTAAAPPSSLSVRKASSSAALTNADESSDFQRFLDEAHAKDDLQRQKRAQKSANLAPDSQGPRRPGAAESLRRVTSSSTLNGGAPTAPSSSMRGNTTLSIAPRASRSVSNYSVTFRNPTSQFLEQLSVDAQTPELGIDDTPVNGRTVDNKSHLTALGHAAQLQSRSASGSQPPRNATVKGKTPTSRSVPARSSTIAVESPVAIASRTSLQPAVSVPQRSPTSTLGLTSPTARSQPLSPTQKPQSFIHKSSPATSDIASPKRLGATDLGLGLPTSPGASPTQAKRSADEMERSSSLHPSAKLQEETSNIEASALQQSPSQPASRRKTWFGLGWATETDEPAPTEIKDEPMQASDPVADQPPPPINEGEAEFRRSLGYNDVSDASAVTESAGQVSSESKVFPTGRDSDATMKVEPSIEQIPVRERRLSWLPWRNIAPPAALEATVPSKPVANGDDKQQQQASTDELAPQAAASTSDTVSEQPDATAQDAGHANGDRTVTYRTVVKRGWMGARYEVQEPVPNLRDMFDTPASDTPQAQEEASAAVAGDEAAVASKQASYPPAASPGQAEHDVRQGSSTWRWRFWSGHEDRPEVDENSAAQQLQVPAALPEDAADTGKQSIRDTDTAVPMDIDQEDKGPAGAPAAPEGGSWTYSSYLASWVPTWAYNAQQQEAAAARDAVETGAPSQTAADAPPRTPAEQVKADALARDAAAAVFDANRAVLNNATRSGWINFFASRSANLPREARDTITNDDGMEVMDISGIEGGSRPAVAKTIASSNGRLAPEGSSAARAKTTKAGSLAGSRASSLAGDSEGIHTAARSLTSKDSIKNLGKAAITKAANVTAASNLGLGKGKRTDGAQASGSGNGSNGANSGSNGQPAKDISKKLAPNGSGSSRPGTPAPTKSAGDPIPVTPPNLVLPSFEDTFARAPRMWSPKVGVLERTLSAVNSYLFSKVPDLDRMKRPTRFSTYGEPNLGSSASSFKGSAASFAGKGSTQRLAGKAKATGAGSSKDKGVETALKEVAESAQRLPRAWSTVGLHERAQCKGTAGIGKIVVIGVHGWFSQSIFKTVIGEPTGTSAKFAAMQTESIRRHFLEAGLELNPEAITAISLHGDGKVADRVDRLFSELISRPNWVNDLKNADAVFLSAHSQGAIVATQLLARLIEQQHIRADSTRICLLAMCGVHHGPFAHLKSSITASYINYFENAAAKELFEFQSSSTAAAKQYTAALKIILDAGVKCVYVGSTDDNVVPIYSALNSSNDHTSILRALYIDGRAFPKVDFLTNLLVLCVAVRNAGLSDHNLLTLLSASVAGSLYGGLGHSLVYEERAVYDLATRYLFEVTHPLAEPTFAPGPPGMTIEPRRPTDTDPANAPTLISDAFEAQRWNPYDLPWSLRGLFEDKHVRSLFAADMLSLLQSYEEWRPDPKSKSLKDLQWRLAPMRSIRPPEVEGDGGEAESLMEEDEKTDKGDKGGKGKGKDGKGSKL